MFSEIISALIGSLTTIIADTIFHLIRKNNKKKSSNKENSTSVSFLKKDFQFDKLLSKVSSLMMYTVNSHYLVNQLYLLFKQNPKLQLRNVTVLVRKKVDETPDDIDILNTNINLWKRMVEEGYIKKLTIIGYAHDPDHYYTIIGDKLVFCGQVHFDSNMPTATSVNHTPIVFTDDSETGRNIIKNYQSHFDNVVEHYRAISTLYTTEK